MNLSNLLEASVSFSEKATDGLLTFLIGICVVFGGMAILILCVSLFGKAVEKIANAFEEKNAKKEKTEISEVKDDEDGIPNEVRVAIIAAVAAYCSESGSKNEFIVRKIKRVKEK